ncbi:MAG: S8 family serine peptidase, partial [bacterium]
MCICAVTAVLLWSGTTADAQAPEHHVLVKINPSFGDPRSVLDTALRAVNQRVKATAIKDLRLSSSRSCTTSGPVFLVVVHAADISEVIRQYEARPEVVYAEEDTPVFAYYTPDDPQYPTQWNMQKVSVEGAWEYDTSPPLYGGDPTIVVAVLDSGVAYETYTDGPTEYQKSPDFGSTTFVAGYDFTQDDAHPNDDNGHGTHVAGTIAENTNNAVAAAGIAFHTSIMPIKVLDRTGIGMMSEVARGVDFAVTNGAKVINLSLGSTIDSKTLHDAVTNAISSNVVVVAAAGNDSRGSLSYPASYSGVISVAAIGRDDVLATYSNYGSGLSISAPGGDDGEYIWQESFSNLDSNNLPLDYTTFGVVGYQGTSQATPHVSAAAALLIAKGVSGTNMKALLEATADDLGTAGYDTQYGYGRLNIQRAFSTYLNDTIAPVSAISVYPTVPNGQNGYYTTKPYLTISASDEQNGSGVAHVYYSWDAQPAVLYSDMISPDEGTHQLSFYTVDAAGNVEAAQTAVYRVDTVGPVVTITSPGTTINSQSVVMRGKVTDAASGVASLTLDATPVSFDAAGVFSLTKTFPAGKTVVNIIATDIAGGTTSTTHAFTVTTKSRIVTAPLSSGGPQVIVSSNTGKKISSFFGFAKTFRGGISVASGDVNADGHEEIIVAPYSNGSPQIRIFNSRGKVLGQFIAYAKSFTGGVRVAAGDLNGDGKDEIVTAPGPGG